MVAVKTVLYIVPKSEEARALYSAQIAVHNANREDSGFDLFVMDDTHVLPYSNVQGELLDSGISGQMVEFHDGQIPTSTPPLEETDLIVFTGFDLIPRSSIRKLAMRQPNSPGLIDHGYRGPLLMPVQATRPEGVHIEKHARYFQVVAPGKKWFEVRIVSKLGPSKRGAGGFGSTGTHEKVMKK